MDVVWRGRLELFRWVTSQAPALQIAACGEGVARRQDGVLSYWAMLRGEKIQDDVQRRSCVRCEMWCEVNLQTFLLLVVAGGLRLPLPLPCGPWLPRDATDCRPQAATFCCHMQSPSLFDIHLHSATQELSSLKMGQSSQDLPDFLIERCSLIASSSCEIDGSGSYSVLLPSFRRDPLSDVSCKDQRPKEATYPNSAG